MDLLNGSKKIIDPEVNIRGRDQELKVLTPQIPLSITDQYDINQIIGKGSFGRVYQVQSKKDNSLYALKCIPMKSICTIYEVVIMTNFQHPNLLHAKEVYINDVTSIIMELAEGDLRNLLKTQFTTIMLDRKITWMWELLSAIQVLHREGYVHWDLRSDNILVKDHKMILSDFSLSHPISQEYEIGNWSRLPPEEYLTYVSEEWDDVNGYLEDPVFKQRPKNKYLIDLWALGTIFFELFTNKQLLFPNSEPFSKQKDLFNVGSKSYSSYCRDPEGYLRTWIVNDNGEEIVIPFLMKMLNPWLRDRYETAKEMLMDPLFDAFR